MTRRPPRPPLLGLFALALLLGACAGEPSPPSTSPEPQRTSFTLGRRAIRALRDYLYAGYALRLHADQAGASDPDLEAALDEARHDLRDALVEAGADPARAADREALLDLAAEGVAASGRYAFLRAPGDGGVALMRIAAEHPDRELRLFGQPYRYDVVLYDETLIQDYATWREARFQAGAVRRALTYSEEGTIRIDLPAIREIARERFLSRVDELRGAAERIRDPEVVQALATQQGLPDLLRLTRDALRWRSLEQLWSQIRSLPEEEQVRRFVEDYAARAELRAAAELRELERFQPADGALTAEARLALAELGTLSAMLHGEPLGQAADLLALVVVSLERTDRPAAAPAFAAARRLVAELVAHFREGPAGDQADAVALQRLAVGEPRALHDLARALHTQRLRALGR